MTRRAILNPRPAMDGYLTARSLALRLCVGTRTVWRMVQRGDLPQPMRFTRKLVRFHWAGVVEHLKQIERGRREQAAGV